jgi:hypothetical protein
MRYWLLSLRMWVALAVLALGSPWLCTVHAGPRDKKPIEIIAPVNSSSTNTLRELTGKKDNGRQLGDDLYKPALTFPGASSLESVGPLPQSLPMPSVPSKRLKEQLDRRKNFYLLTPEDVMQAPTLKEMLKIPEYGADGREKQSKTAMELYNDRQDAKHLGVPKANRFSGDDYLPDTADLPIGRDAPKGTDDRLPAALEEKEQALKKLFQADAGDNPLAPAAPKRGTFSDVFGLGDVTPTKEQALEHKKYMADFSAIFEPSRPRATPETTLKPAPASTESSKRLANPFGVPDTSPLGNETFGFITPVFSPVGPPDANARLPGQATLAPKAELPRGPVAPTFAAPRRPF